MREEDADRIVQNVEAFFEKTGAMPAQNRHVQRSAENALADQLRRLKLSAFPALELRVARMRKENADSIVQKLWRELKQFQDANSGHFPQQSKCPERKDENCLRMRLDREGINSDAAVKRHRAAPGAASDYIHQSQPPPPRALVGTQTNSHPTSPGPSAAPFGQCTLRLV